MNREIRLAYINQLREKYNPYLCRIAETDEENETVRISVLDWEAAEARSVGEALRASDIGSVEYEAAVAEFEVLVERHRQFGSIFPRGAFDLAVSVLYSRGWRPPQKATNQHELNV